jgi:predicted DNA-binding ribbon-helix-helix protein
MTATPSGKGNRHRRPAAGRDLNAFVPRMSRPVKRSFSIGGHRTSISLEAPFWEALKTVAAQEKLSLSSLIARVDAEREDSGLSSAIRVWLLDYYRNERRREGT